LPGARRETAMYHIIESLVRWLAPILSFTAEDIWQAMPGYRNESVLLNTWYEVPDMYASADEENEAMTYWQKVIGVRDAVNKELEKLRVAGEIGSGLAAEVSVHCGREIYDVLAALEDELRFVFITSTANIALDETPLVNAEHYTLESNDEIWVSVNASAAVKCVRCWHHRADVGSNDKHPELCGRCVEKC